MLEPPPRKPSWSPPSVIGEYRLLRLLGRGAMGQIHLAEDTLLERPVAVKFIASIRPSEAARRRFYVEARAIARLVHPNVVAVHRVGEVDGRPYLVTEFVRGKTLADLEKPVPWARALRMGMGLARGVSAAHRQGVLHRDIKPANVMLTDEGEIKLLDFGLAKLLTHVSGAALDDEHAPQDGLDPEDTGDEGARHASGERALTKAGSIVGTPRYMAPEALRGEPATRRSDVYALGAVLYELSAGMAPRDDASEDGDRDTWIDAEPPALADRAPGVDARFAAVVARCLSRDPQHRYASADELLDALVAVGPEQRRTSIPEGNPYRGLSPFEPEHRGLFFGRGAEIRAVVERLRAEPLVVVAGDSGVGKSSLCRAGVLPLASEGALEDGRRQHVVSLVPGRRPLSALVSAAASALGADEDPLMEAVRADPRSLGRELHRVLGKERGALFFVDQLEELFTLSDPEEAARFGEAVAELGMIPAGIRVLMTVRGDYFTRLAALPGLGEDVSRALYLLRPLSPEATREAVVGPLDQKGFKLESDAMVEMLVQSSAAAAGGLPLLQFAMAELWDARDEEAHTIPVSALEAMGGVGGALARHADAVIARLPSPERSAARRVLLRLVTAEGTRARRTEGELGAEDPATRAAIEALVRGRLVVAREVEGETAYEVAHEALIHGWDTLRRWLESDGEKRVIRERIEAAAVEWERLGRAPEALWSGRRLDEAESLDGAELSPRAQDLLVKSRAEIRRARLRRWGAGLSVPIAIGAALLGLRWKSARDLARLVGEHVGTAEIARGEGRAQSAKADALRREAYKLFDGATGATAEEVGPEKEAAEKVWAEALERAREAEAKLVRAGQSLEAALALEPSKASIRGAIGDVTMERLTLAEAFHAEERRADLLLRVKAYDPDGKRDKAIGMAPVITIDSTPPGAAVVLERYEDKQGRKTAVMVGELGKTPLRGVAVQGGEGSYRLTLRAPGRVEVRYPVLLGRGERFEATVDMPEEKGAPQGYAYVPAGRFLLGSADPEGLRKGLMTCPPLHEARTGAFFISRTEVTFGEWLAYLDDLPPDERAKRTPQYSSRIWAVEVTRPEGGAWQIALTLNGARQVARQGEPIRLPARPRRAEIRWERLPVSGVSLQDAEAYFAWLDKTGRVRGARLCDEWEWERAARGADARVFPHGDALDPEDANFDQTYGRKALAFGPDEVGSHPASESPFGVLDMTGNVYEWTRSRGAAGEAVMRGGSWYYDNLSDMIPNRTMGEVQTRDIGTGVRGCAGGEWK